MTTVKNDNVTGSSDKNRTYTTTNATQTLADNVTWARKVARTKGKIRTSSSARSWGSGEYQQQRKQPLLRSKQHKAQVEEALGDILIERIFDMDASLLDTVPTEEWETLLAVPVEVMQDILWNMDYHEERGLVLGWKGVQIMVLSHTMGIEEKLYSIGLWE